jgi:LmbE family N-acetylglucosaminyl deacetylase
MLNLPIIPEDRPLHILCLGAHCDDIEIGCGATMLSLAQQRPNLSFTWVVFSSNEIRAAEAKNSFDSILEGADSASLDLRRFRNGYFPFVGVEIKDYFEHLKSKINPDLIFTHYGQDYHQDHRLVSELTWNTFRDHWILEYEIPKFDGGLGTPNVYVPVATDHVRRKSEILLKCFASQTKHSWFSQSTFDALMRLRGVECNADSGYAEAFYSRKMVFG